MTYADLEFFAEETSQWADAHQLEAVLEEVFDAIAFDLSTFGDDAGDVVYPYGRGFGAVDMGGAR